MSPLRFIFCPLLFVVLTASSAHSDEIDDYIKSELTKQKTPGLSLAVVKDGSILKAQGYGLANVELNVPATAETVYQLASVTKQFTATAIMQLIEDGKFSLADRVTKLLTNTPPAWSNITVRHLLDHTSGIKSYTSLPSFGREPRKDYTHEQLMALVSDLPLEFEPGKQHRYNNTGYFLLGMIIEKISGQSYGRFLEERIFRPLGMTHSRLNKFADIVPHRAMGYTVRNDKLFNGEYVSPTQPFAAGALLSTVLDLARWDAALYSSDILKRSSLQQMWTPLKLNSGESVPYGFGWSVGETKGHKYVQHSGGITGFRTHLNRFLDDKLTVIVLMNSGSANPEAIAAWVAGRYIPELRPVELAAPKKNGPGAPDEIDQYVLAEMQRQNVPGLSLAVVRRGELVKAEGYGLADVDKNIPVSTNTAFQIQSITKTFTASAVMLLVNEGKIGLDDRISKYLDDVPDTWKDVTVRHLLTHTSGIKDFINEPTVDLKKDLAPQDVITSLAKLPLNFAVGEKYSYSNTGYHLLGMIIHKVTGQPWQEVLRQRIFEPLGMTDTDIIGVGKDRSDLAKGYTRNESGLRPGAFIAPSILGYAGGGIRSTVLDLAGWDRALVKHELLKPSILDQMWTRATLNDGSRSDYGLGWAVEEVRGHRLISHTGAHATGFRSALNRYPDDELTVIVFLNQRGGDPSAIAAGVAGRLIPGMLLSSLKETEDPDAERTARLRRSLTDLAKGVDSPELTPQFRAEYAKSDNRATALAERLADLKTFTFLRCDEPRPGTVKRLGVDVSRICHYKMVTANETRYYTFYLTTDGKLAYYQSSAE